MISTNQVHVISALGNVSLAYDNPGLVFQKEIAPVIPVDFLSDEYFTFSKQHFRTTDDSTRPGDDANILTIDLDAKKSYSCDGHALDLPIPDRLAANADPGADLDIEITEKITGVIRLNEEVNGKALITTANISQNITLSGTSQFTDRVNSDPFSVIDTGKTTIEKSTGKLPNKITMSRYGFLKLRNHPLVIDRVKYTGNGVRQPLTAAEIAEAFEVDHVVIAAGLKQQNPEGRADSLDYIWGKDILLHYTEPNPGKRKVSLAYTFVSMVSPVGSSESDSRLLGNQGGFLVTKYRDQGRRSDVIAVEYYYDQKLIEPNCGYLIVSAFA